MSNSRCSMHQHTAHPAQHAGESRTKYVLALTLITMIVEIAAGTLYGSMALLADGWHMGTHAAAFCITLFAYRYARQHAGDSRFSFGTGKVSVLGGYTSAIALGIVALIMFVESLLRLFNPHAIQFNEAIVVAVIGLVVNLASMLLLGDHHSHDHHAHEHGSNHTHHHDHNLRAAYMHVLADALTSLLAIMALIVGKYLGWIWLDALMGMVGALVIAKWTLGLMKQTSPILLDESIDDAYKRQVQQELEKDATVTDLHVWKVSADHYAAAISLTSRCKKTTDEYRQQLEQFDKIHHLTLEVTTGH
ncbi:CDF family Co(II)/Ni(II) efflux transporter DmeF [Vibrio proteolyticus]